MRYNFINRNTTGSVTIYQNALSTVAYPTGAISRYTFGRADGGVGNWGWFEYYRLTSRQDEADGSIYNRSDLTYTNNYSGYPIYSNMDDLPGSYTYNTSILYSNSVNKTYTFNNNHLLSKTETYNPVNIKRHEEALEYDTNKHLTKRVQTFYNGSIARTATELFTYDIYHNLTVYWDTQAQGNHSNIRNRTTTTYGAYGIPLITTFWKQAAGDNITTITNTLAADGAAAGKAIGEIKTTIVNGFTVTQNAQFTYDSYGNVASKRDYVNPNQYIQTTYTYSGHTNSSGNTVGTGVFVSREDIQESDSPDVFTKQFTYDVFGRLKTLKDGKNNVTSYEYDPVGRLTRKNNPGGSFSTIAYNDSLRTMTATDENGGKIMTTYNRLGYPALIQEVTGAPYKLASYAYDSMSRLKTEQDSKNTETVYEYDYLDRLTSKGIGPNGSLYKETYLYNDAYDANHSRVEKTILGGIGSPSIKTASYTNTHGFTTKTSRWINNVEVSDTFTFDFLGNPVTATTSDNRVTKYVYDFSGRLSQTINPDNSVYKVDYDWLGRKISGDDPRGKVTQYQYNALGLVTSERVPFEGNFDSTTTYCYDQNGNLTSQRQSNNKPGMAASESRIDYEYNNRDFLTRVNSYNDNVIDNYVTYEYDNVGNKASMVAANGTQTTQYQYDKQNRLIKLTDPMGMFEEYTYDNNNNLLTKTDRNKNVTTNTYDLLNRITHVSVRRANGSTAPEYIEYGYAQTGLKTSEKNENLTIAYEYDNAGRLTKQTETAVSTPGANIVKNYTYDIHNNRKSFTLTQGGVTRQWQTYDYDSMNRLWKVYINGAQEATYTYDAYGNQL